MLYVVFVVRLPAKGDSVGSGSERPLDGQPDNISRRLSTPECRVGVRGKRRCTPLERFARSERARERTFRSPVTTPAHERSRIAFCIASRDSFPQTPTPKASRAGKAQRPWTIMAPAARTTERCLLPRSPRADG